MFSGKSIGWNSYTQAGMQQNSTCAKLKIQCDPTNNVAILSLLELELSYNLKLDKWLYFFNFYNINFV